MEMLETHEGKVWTVILKTTIARDKLGRPVTTPEYFEQFTTGDFGKIFYLKSVKTHEVVAYSNAAFKGSMG